MSYKKSWRIGLLVLLVGLLAFGWAIVGFADNNSGYDGDATKDCDSYENDKDLPAEIRGLDLTKFEPVDDGETTQDGVTVDVKDTESGQEFDWESERPVEHVFVKGGDMGCLYSYAPALSEDEGLHAPYNVNSEEWYGLSHITFFFAEIEPGLQITKEADTEVSTVGNEINYTVVVTNTGDTDLEEVVVDDALQGELFDDDLAAGASETFEYEYTVQEGDPDPLVNTAMATGDHDDLDYTIEVAASESVDLVEPKIELTKTVEPDAAEIGDEVTYTIEVENTGDHPLEIIEVTDDLLGSDITANFGFDELLDPNDSETADFDYIIEDEDVEDDQVINTAEVYSNPVGLPNDIYAEGTVEVDVEEDIEVEDPAAVDQDIEITLEKEWELDEDAEIPEEWSVEVFVDDENVASIGPEAETDSFEISPGDSYRVEELRLENEEQWDVKGVGDDFEAPGEDYNHTVTNRYVEMIEKEEPELTEIAPEPGALNVQKEFNLDDADEELKPESVEITITGEEGASYTDGDTKEITAEDDWQFTWEVLEPGQYKTTEKNLEEDGEVEVTLDEVTVKEGETEKATIISHYDPDIAEVPEEVLEDEPELPETGGGVLPLMPGIGGLIAAAGALMLAKRKDS